MEVLHYTCKWIVSIKLQPLIVLVCKQLKPKRLVWLLILLQKGEYLKIVVPRTSIITCYRELCRISSQNLEDERSVIFFFQWSIRHILKVGGVYTSLDLISRKAWFVLQWISWKIMMMMMFSSKAMIQIYIRWESISLPKI